MKNIKRWAILAVAVVGLIFGMAAAQKIETVDGVRIVHNEKGGIWAGSPKVKLELVRTIGGPRRNEPRSGLQQPL